MNKNFKNILLEINENVATVTLNRPDVHNAFNNEMITEIAEAFKGLEKNKEARVVLLQGNGKSFSAGADLNWMKKAAGFGKAKNISDAKRLHQMFLSIEKSPKPVIAKIHGAALGGACGLVAAADMAYAYEDAQFGFSEVRLGLIPAVIAPFVLKKIGVGFAREFFLTGERFGAAVACRIGLIHGEGNPQEIDAVVRGRIEQILQGAPGAIAAAKKLIDEVQGSYPAKLGSLTARRIADRRASAEGREGMDAFLNKRPPKWVKKSHED
jgi:methylglutaconyl-CoA hydratase